MASAWNEIPLHDQSRPAIWRTAAFLVLVYYLIDYSNMTISRLIRFPSENIPYLVPRAIVTLASACFAFAIVALQIATAGQPLGRRIAITVLAALAGCAFHITTNQIVFDYIFVVGTPLTTPELALAFMDWMWFYLSFSAMILALSYNASLRDRERRLAVLANRAHTAQIKALRYQLNPHFLFNTLNAIAALVHRKQNPIAEAMIENLSDFLRTGLSLDPHEDIPFQRELDLQALYLEIERLRFPGRLNVDIQVPAELREAMVPSLITQPLIENAVKYAVARSSVPVDLTICATRQDGRLHVAVTDNGGDAPPAPEGGTKLGLRNVEERLHARFGGDCDFEARPRPGGGFAVSFAIPLSLRECGR